jgi:hypothetical protein
MNFFLWGHIKAPIHTSPVDSEEDLLPVLLKPQQPSGSNMAFLSARTPQSLLRRCRLCIEAGGRTYEHTL